MSAFEADVQRRSTVLQARVQDISDLVYDGSDLATRTGTSIRALANHFSDLPNATTQQSTRDLIATTGSSKLLALSNFVQGLSVDLLDLGGFCPGGQHEVYLRLTLRTLELAKAFSDAESLLLLDPLPLPRAFNDETDSELRSERPKSLRTLSIEARNDLADGILHLEDRSRCGTCRHILEKMVSEGKTLLTKLTSSEPGVRQGWAFAPDERTQLDQTATVHKDWTEWINQRHSLAIDLTKDQSLTPRAA